MEQSGHTFHPILQAKGVSSQENSLERPGETGISLPDCLLAELQMLVSLLWSRAVE